jgi:hypothetical protein
MGYLEIQGWMDFEDIYVEAVANAPSGASLVEVGVNMGRSLAFLARTAIDRGRGDLSIYGVDNWAQPASTEHAYVTLLATTAATPGRRSNGAWRCSPPKSSLACESSVTTHRGRQRSCQPPGSFSLTQITPTPAASAILKRGDVSLCRVAS